MRVLLLTLLLLLTPGAHADPLERLRMRLEAPEAEAAAALSAGGERVQAAASLRRFYLARDFALAWHSADGRPTKPAHELLQALSDSAADGLHPADYHRAALETLLARQDGGEGLVVDRELLLTDAYLLLASHLLAGRVDPVRIDNEWHAQRREVDLVAHLTQALSAGDVPESLQALRPAQPGYARLRTALLRYREIAAAGGWGEVPAGPALKPGMQGPRVAALRARLVASGDLAGPGAGDAFDPELEAAVRRFQRRHGLEDDAVVGKESLSALNVSAAERVRQIELNLERWRWLPQELGARHIRVNIADFSMELWEQGRPVATQAVVVGRDYRRTPVFSGKMSYLVLNPLWEVPPRIAVEDILPQLRSNPGYLDALGMQVLQGWGADERVVDPASVDWSAVSERGFAYRFRQAPGPRNALGQVKFMFPNDFSVYLHDSPARELFGKRRRAYSSGCIRVQDPVALAAWVLAPSGRWDEAALREALAAGQTRTVTLGQGVPVHIQYWTAWVDADGNVQFREDLYGRDSRLAGAFARPAPGA